MSPPRLLDRRSAASYCGVSVNHFLDHVPVTAVEVGKKRLWDVRALDRWIDGLGGQEHHENPDRWNESLKNL